MIARFFRVLLLAFTALSFVGTASAQSAQTEPTVKQIYDTAQAGQVDKAIAMTKEVLQNHPTSGKAHYVMAELQAGKGNLEEARLELTIAERLAPGLTFAKPEAVQALKSRVAGRSNVPSSSSMGAAPGAAPTSEAPVQPSFPWAAVVGVVAIAAIVLMVLRRRTAARNAAAGYGAGYAPGANPGYGPQPGYGAQPGYGPQAGYGPQPGYGQQPGMGSRIMGGLATGAALGAGALAAHELGKRMFEDRDHPQGGGNAVPDPGYVPIDQPLPDNFGIRDGSSWDDAGSSGGSFDSGGGGDAGGGGSWD
jgi:uncharacterized protein